MKKQFEIPTNAWQIHFFVFIAVLLSMLIVAQQVVGQDTTIVIKSAKDVERDMPVGAKFKITNFSSCAYYLSDNILIDSLENAKSLSLSITNLTTDSIAILLQVSRNKNLVLTQVSQNIRSATTKAFNIPINKIEVENYAFEITLNPSSHHWLLMKSNGEWLNKVDFTPKILSKASFTQARNTFFFEHRNAYAILWGGVAICLVLCMLGIYLFVFNYDYTYLLWSAYISLNGFFFLQYSDYYFNIPNLPFTGFIVPSQYLILGTYAFFLDTFLDLKQFAPKLHRLSMALVIFVGLSFIISFYLMLFKFSILLNFINTSPLIIAEIWYIGILVSCLLANIPQKKVILLGSFGILFFTIWACYIDILYLEDFNYLLKTPVVIYGFGFLIEIIFLSIAVIERITRVYNQARIEQESLKKERNEFQHKLAETEMTALRAQMNPHFIFNCLNSIKLYTLENDSLKATEYMTKFSRLIRLVLENSRSERITLANELETLELYIEMEAMRFKDKVAYQINVSDDVDTHYIEIPPLLIQPFIENAIWHGLMHKEGGGLLTVDVEMLHITSLHITITDNGIGRKAATELKSKSATSNKSFGLKMTSERIELINQLYKSNTQVNIIDLTNSNNQSIGTKVSIEIPV